MEAQAKDGAYAEPTSSPSLEDVPNQSSSTCHSPPSSRVSKDSQCEKRPLPVAKSSESARSTTEQQRHDASSIVLPASATWETRLYGWWTIEILAFVVSLLSFVSIVVVLKHYDGHSTPEWPHNITLNSVLSWFTTLFKTNLLVLITACFGQLNWVHYRSRSRPLTDLAIYDSASRGPMGALQLLWYFKAKYVASIGAIITILAVGIDPIVQQTLAFKVVDRVSASATIGRTQSFVQWDVQYQALASGVNSKVQLPPSDMVGAMFDGMFSGASWPNITSFSPNLSCPSGNCTFSAFQTLAVCSKCDDISTALSQRCNTSAAGGSQGPPQAATFCEYSLPNGLRLNKTLGPSTLATNGSLVSVGPLPYPQSILNFTGIWSGAPNYGPEGKPPLDLDAAGRAQQKALSKDDVTAKQCCVYWCVNTIRSDVVNGQISETQLDSWHSNTPTQSLGNTASGMEALYLRPPPLDTKSPLSDSDFIVARNATQALNEWLSAHLTISTGRNVDLPGEDYLERQRLLQGANITAMFEHLAASMSRNLRSTSQEAQRSSPAGFDVSGVGPANGTATSREILIAIRWPWIAFPATLLVLSSLFFILTLVSTSRHKIAVWKNSPFPLIFNRVDDPHVIYGPEPSLAVPSVEIPDMEQKAARSYARLEESGSGLRLTSQNDHLSDLPSQKNGSS